MLNRLGAKTDERLVVGAKWRDGLVVKAKPKKKSSIAKTVAKARPKKSKPKTGLFGNAARNRALPFSLNHRQITKVFRKNEKQLLRCIKSKPDLKGSMVSLSLTIKRNGKPARVKAVSSAIRGTPIGACIEKSVSGYTFPRFSGDHMQLRIPVRL